MPPGCRCSLTSSLAQVADTTCLMGRGAHTLDPKTRTNSVVLDVPNPNLRLASGMYAEVLWRGSDELR